MPDKVTMKTLNTLLLFTIFLSSAQARLGDTIEQCIASYGPEHHFINKPGTDISGRLGGTRPANDTIFKTGTARAIFKKDDLQVMAEFRDGVAVVIIYNKLNVAEGATAWSEKELRDLADANKEGSTWQITTTPKNGVLESRFRRADGSAVGVHDGSAVVQFYRTN